MRPLSPTRRSWFREHPLIGDSIFAGVLALIAVGLALVIDSDTIARLGGQPPLGFRDMDPLGLTLITLISLPVAVRRQWPFLALVLALLPQAVADVMHYDVGLSAFAFLVLLYSMAAHRGLALSLAGALLSVAGYVIAVVLNPVNLDWTDHLVVFTVLTLSWVIGRSVRLRRAYTAELVDRAERVERARDADTRAARAEERSRIARELHDVVAHHVSVMTVQAAAARRMLYKDPDVVAESLTTIEEMGRTAMNEMRDIVGVLRTDGPAERGPQPGMDDLPSLVEQMREAGLPTQLWLEGERRKLPPGVDLAAYRLVQEALTNSLRHAGPAARAWVTVRQEAAELSVHVEDDGRPGGNGDGRFPKGKGHGLVGIKERVSLYGGVLRIGPRQGGGFEVRAQFPLKDRP